jgi:hypothetical protein
MSEALKMSLCEFGGAITGVILGLFVVWLLPDASLSMLAKQWATGLGATILLGLILGEWHWHYRQRGRAPKQ